MDKLSDLEKMQLADDIRKALSSAEYDVAQRNQYMNKRDRYVYGDGLWETLDIPDGFDRTKYNYLKRVVEIHTSQFMGRPHQVYSQYNKEDISLIEMNDQLDPETKDTQLTLAEMRNKKKKSNADTRKNLLDAIRRDNGGAALYEHGAKIGSTYGETIFKQWPDFKEKKVKRTVIETPQNWRAGWSDSNFRHRDWDAYVYQISPIQANLQYGSVLGEGESFDTALNGFPFANNAGNNMTSDPLDQRTNASHIPQQTQQRMVNVVDLTGYLPGWGFDKGEFKQVKPGKETRFNAMTVGNRLAFLETNEDKLPKYYRIPNKLVPQRAFGESDLPDSALEINATLMERMSDWITVANKTLFPLIQAKGFENTNVPRKQQRQMKVVPMAPDQSLEVVGMPNNFGFDYDKIITQLETAFVRVTGIGRVLFDDPQQANSNQALITTMKGVIDIVEGKQKRWEPVLLEMDNDALDMTAKLLPDLKEVIYDDPASYLYIQWPSVLRREDQVYQAQLVNRFNTGTISVESFLEAQGVQDVQQEIDRIRDNMKDAVMGGILTHELGQIAARMIYKSFGTPPPPDVKIALRGELTPNQEANLAQQRGLQDGPWAPSAGPQGREGQAANDNQINQGYLNGNPFEGGTPVQLGPDGQPVPSAPQQPQAQNLPQGQPGNGQPAAPIVTPSQNTPGSMPMSQPGTGATTQSTQGAVNAAHHNRK